MLVVNWARVFPLAYPVPLVAMVADDLIAVLWLLHFRRCSWMQHCLGLASAVRFAGTLITSSKSGSNLWIYQWTDPLTVALLIAALVGWAPRQARVTLAVVGAVGVASFFALGAFISSELVFKDLNEVVLAAFVLACATIALAETSMRERILWGPVVWAALGSYWYWGSVGIFRAFSNPLYQADPANLRTLLNVTAVFQALGAICWMAALPVSWKKWPRRLPPSVRATA